MKYEYTCNYETSLEYVNNLQMKLIKKSSAFDSTMLINIAEALSTSTKKEFKSTVKTLFEKGHLEIWFNPQVVELANSLLTNEIVNKGSELKQTLELLQSEDAAWDFFEEGPNTLREDWLNVIPNNNIPYVPAGGRIGLELKNLLQKSYDDGTLLKYPINEILYKVMGNIEFFIVNDVTTALRLTRNFWSLYSAKLDWYYGAGWAVFKIPLQHPSKPFMNWYESPLEVKE